MFSFSSLIHWLAALSLKLPLKAAASMLGACWVRTSRAWFSEAGTDSLTTDTGAWQLLQCTCFWQLKQKTRRAKQFLMENDVYKCGLALAEQGASLGG